VSPEEKARLETNITRSDAFDFLASYVDKNVPESSKYIKLNFKDVLPGSALYTNLQKLVYLDLIKNADTYISPQKTIDVYSFQKLTEKILGVSVIDTAHIEELKTVPTKEKDLEAIEKIIDSKK